MPRSARIASASIDVGPFAPSATSLASIRGAFSAVSWSSSAASDEDVAGQLEQLLVRDVLAVRDSPRASRARRSSGRTSARSRPAGVVDAARDVRDRQTTSRPGRRARCAAMPPTLPKPWTTQRCSPRFQPSRWHARSITITTPAPVASRRNTEPPIEIGLPVTISGTA